MNPQFELADANDMMGNLPFAQRDPINRWLDIIQEVERAEDKLAAVAQAIARHRGSLKISMGTLYRKRAAYLEDGVIGLFPAAARRRFLDNTSLDPHFIAFWQQRCCESQRVTAAAYRCLFHDWLCAGRCIPGYGPRPEIGMDWRGIYSLEHGGAQPPAECPYSPDRVTPKGWKSRNLYRYAPNAYALTAARIGTAAARELLPKLPSTRVGLRFGQVFIADDRVHDAKVKLGGNIAAHPVVELGAIELLTAMYCAWGCKPIRERPDGTREVLREVFMRYLLVEILCRIGYDPNGAVMIGEGGTARLPADTQALLKRITNDKFQFTSGAILNAPIARGLMPGVARGNFRMKAALESAHNRYKNDLALLPGQKGADPKHAPEDLAAKDSYHRYLMKACLALASTRGDLLSHVSTPYPDYHRYVEAVSLVYDRVAMDPNHRLEGWYESGFIVEEFLLPGFAGPQPMSILDDMSAEDRTIYLGMIRKDPRRQVNRRMSRAEAFAHCERTTEVMRVSESRAPEILGRELGNVLTVNRDATLSVPDAYVPGREHGVAAVAVLPNGCQQPLDRGSSWLVHLSPLNAREAYISTPDGVYVGKAPVLVPGTKYNVNHANLAILRNMESQELKRLAPVAEKRLREQTEMREHNTELLTGSNPVADYEAAEARREELAGFQPADLVGEDDAAQGDDEDSVGALVSSAHPFDARNLL